MLIFVINALLIIIEEHSSHIGMLHFISVEHNQIKSQNNWHARVSVAKRPGTCRLQSSATSLIGLIF